ncbi:GNAT family N-acetyltransferase [Mesobaculum littorinae]|nr:GNAT family N-acetyltransferase [Mesobaculum littorinae]
MSVQCRRAGADDGEAVADLIEDLQAYHDLPRQSRAEILSDLATMPEGFEVWLAEDDARRALGIALACVYPGPGIAAGCYLKELFVTSRARQGGVGRALMQALAASALARGAQRIDWVTSWDNEVARSFYDGLGAQANGNKLFYRIDGDALATLAGDAG